MMETRTTIDQAAAWHAMLESPAMDWDALGLWLAADPSHRGAYDAIAALDDEIATAAPALHAMLAANDETDDVSDARSPVGRWAWAALGTGVAAAATIAFMIATPRKDGPPRVFATDPGETRSVMLADGSRMLLDRRSRVSVTGGPAPSIEIAQGAVSFTVRHNPARVFVVRAGDYEIRDVGTRFDVVSAPDRVAVTVAQGAVSIASAGSPAADATLLRAGQGIEIIPTKQIAQRRSINPARVADWADGRLDYDGAPLALVAADISRYVDGPLVVDASAAHLRFSGVLTIGDGSRLVDQLRAVLPIDVRRIDDVVHLGRAGAR